MSLIALGVTIGSPDTTAIVPVTDSNLASEIAQAVTDTATLATNIYLPPGYLRAFRFNLTVEFCNEFGVEPMPRTLRIADVSKRNLKRINNPDDLMSIPYALISRRGRFNIFTNTPS